MSVQASKQQQAQQGMLANVLRQFDHAADYMELDSNIRKILSITNNEIVVHFPVKMDDESIQVFTGYRVQHNNALGPYKGGLRYHYTVDIDAARALAMWMTWKTSLAGIPYGGAKGGIQLDPAQYSAAEMERITRRFTYALGDNIGPELDIPAPDVNTNSQIMAWISDTFMSTKAPAERSKHLHVVTGKPLAAGGSEGRDRATGYGVFLTIKFWAAYRNVDLKGKRFIVQGFGNVGYWASHFMEQEGAILVAVQDAHGCLHNDQGISVTDLLAYTKTNQGTVKGYDSAVALPKEDFFGVDCEICIPSALGNQITMTNAHTVKASLIAEGANGPIERSAEKIILEKGIEIIPDILCNSGGVIGSYFEWLQNRHGEIWTLDEVLEKLETKMKASFDRVWKASETKNIDMRTAAFVLAIERLEQNYAQRGIYP